VKQPLITAFGGYQIGDCAPAFGIVHGGDDAARFVQGEVSVPAWWRDTRAVDSDHIPFRIDSSPLLKNNLRVDLDASLADEDFGCPTRGNSGCGQNLLETYPGCRLGH
jgi:hypothetical protein